MHIKQKAMAWKIQGTLKTSRMCMENKSEGKGHKARQALADASLPHLGDKNE